MTNHRSRKHQLDQPNLLPGSASSSTNSSGAKLCFAGPMMEEIEDISSATPLVGSSDTHAQMGKAHYVIYSPEGQGSDTVLTSRDEH